jgi:hypothetical protein
MAKWGIEFVRCLQMNVFIFTFEMARGKGFSFQPDWKWKIGSEL